MKKNSNPAMQKYNKMVQAKNGPRNRRILDLSIAGMSEREIADEITRDGRWGSISDTTAHRVVCAALDRENELLSSKQDQLIRKELDRLDRMTVALFANRNDPRTADTMLRIMERRAKYLGLDSPIKIDANNRSTGEMKHTIDVSKIETPDLDAIIAILDKTENGEAK
jgi:hypothetical protein